MNRKLLGGREWTGYRLQRKRKSNSFIKPYFAPEAEQSILTTSIPILLNISNNLERLELMGKEGSSKKGKGFGPGS